MDAADDYNGWQPRGSTRAFWLWSAGAVAWLDDTDGVPESPIDLRLKTPGTVAVHGPDAPGYLRPEFDAPNRREILAALGVAGEPSTRDLVERLRRLRALAPPPDTVATDAAIVYQALADRLASRLIIPGDVSEGDLRSAFAEGEGLIHTQLGWRTPTQVLAGSPVFRRRHPFVPQVLRADRLWSALRVRQPSLEDCLRVIGQVARSRRAPEGDDILVVLETLRLVGERIAATPKLPSQVRRRLAALPIWTTTGWTSERPAYAVDDPALIEGLRSEVPVWEPGGELAQFANMLAPLRITRLAAEATTVVDPSTERDDDATELLAAAVSLLQDDLARNDSRAAGSLTIGWDQLRDFEVRVDPDLRVRVDGLIGSQSVEVGVATKADVISGVMFLRESRLLRQVDGGGRAVAGLFATADRRQLAQAWLAACVAADEGRTAQRLELAEQEAAEERARREQEMAERTAALAQEIAGRQSTGDRRRHRRSTSSGEREPGKAVPQQQTRPQPIQRVLVDPSCLVVANPNGRRGGVPGSGGSSPRRRSGSSPLPLPDRSAGSPRASAAPTSFTPLDKESVGLELARLVLAGDADEIVDLRAQRGIGADAVDTLDRFFELKVHLGDEPDTIHLEESQVRRALSTPNFFLVVVSNVEGANARPKVRIVVDPVHQLTMTPSSSVSFTGVRGAEHSLVYELEPMAAPPAAAADSSVTPGTGVEVRSKH